MPLFVGVPPTVSPPMVMVTALPKTMLAPEVVITMQPNALLGHKTVGANVEVKPSKLLATIFGVTPFAKIPALYWIVMVPPEGSVVVGMKVTVSLTPALFKRRSRGSIVSVAAETEVAATC